MVSYLGKLLAKKYKDAVKWAPQHRDTAAKLAESWEDQVPEWQAMRDAWHADTRVPKKAKDPYHEPVIGEWINLV
jgi:ABC-type nitrate/sulfonate/bicarbonate transport system substrate-binding protein